MITCTYHICSVLFPAEMTEITISFQLISCTLLEVRSQIKLIV